MMDTDTVPGTVATLVAKCGFVRRPDEVATTCRNGKRFALWDKSRELLLEGRRDSMTGLLARCQLQFFKPSHCCVDIWLGVLQSGELGYAYDHALLARAT